MPDLSSVAREAAEREYPLPDDLSTTSHSLRLVAREHFANGFTECASRLPSEDELAEELSKHKLVHVSVSRKGAFCRCNSSVKAGTDENLEWFEAHRAQAVLSLVGEHIMGTE